MPSTPEPFSRILIDKALEASGWNLLDSRQVRFEVHTGGKRADYVLMDKLGRGLCVLEAKRADLDPYDAKEQARGYAENLHAPFVILSNGKDHYFWNYERADQRDASNSQFGRYAPAGFGNPAAWRRIWQSVESGQVQIENCCSRIVRRRRVSGLQPSHCAASNMIPTSPAPIRHNPPRWPPRWRVRW
ncbi:MAG: type I restriction enzyme HsdR N-terminal domain-containing protein [Chloroflexi bacterium]|nr:type I restriction enzyme HsdR N-terminal domain-containing protein [Chloroflexota bacterium]